MKKCVMGLMLLAAPLALADTSIEFAVFHADDQGAITETSNVVLVADNSATAPTTSGSPSPSLMEPTNPGEALGFFGPLIEAFKSKNWEAFAALLIMLLVYGLRILVPTLQAKPHVLALISAAVGVVASIAMNLHTQVGVVSSIVSGLFMGAAASGFWSQLFKFVFPKKDEAPAAQ